MARCSAASRSRSIAPEVPAEPGGASPPIAGALVSRLVAVVPVVTLPGDSPAPGIGGTGTGGAVVDEDDGDDGGEDVDVVSRGEAAGNVAVAPGGCEAVALSG